MDKYHSELVGSLETFSLRNGPDWFWWAQSPVQAFWAEDALLFSAHFLSKEQR